MEVDTWAMGYRGDNKGAQICAWGWAQVETEIQGVSSFCLGGGKRLTKEKMQSDKRPLSLAKRLAYFLLLGSY
jgi:hypothetical protein